MDDWCRAQTETYLFVGIFFPIFIGFLVGSAVAIAMAVVTWPAVFIGTCVTVWAWVILLRKHYV